MNEVPIIYLDHAAATPLDQVVLRAMEPFLTDNFYNPSSPYAPAVKVRRQLEEARHRLAVCIGAHADDIILTAGATESIALALTAGTDGHIITTAIEHPAVLENARRYDLSVVSVERNGRIDPAAIEQAITAQTQIVSVGLANSELGTIQPLKEIAALVAAERSRRQDSGEDRPIWLHSDASQGAGLYDMNLSRLGVDLLTINAAKLYGPKQVGLLWRRPGIKLRSLFGGGGQEMGLRSGTESVAGAVGFATALERAEKKRKSEVKRLAELRDYMQSELAGAIDIMEVSGSQKHRLPGHLHITFPGVDAERLIFMLESRGVLVATGSACAANKGSRSHVLEAIGMNESSADGSLRITLGRSSTLANIELATAAIIESVQSELTRTGRL